MAKKYGPTLKKLQSAINGTGKLHLTINKTQFYIKESNKMGEIIVVKQATLDKNGNIKYNEVFSSSSDIAITLYLRDVWYELNGWEIPDDNEYWNKTKADYYKRQEARKSKGKGKRA